MSFGEHARNELFTLQISSVQLPFAHQYQKICQAQQALKNLSCKVL